MKSLVLADNSVLLTILIISEGDHFKIKLKF